MEFGALLPLLLLVVVFWFLIVRPARKRQQEQRATVAALAIGRQVMTASGLFGTVTSLTDERVELEIAPGVRVEFVKAAVMQVVPEPSDEPADGFSDEPADGPADEPAEVTGTTVSSETSNGPEDDTRQH